MSLTGPSHTGTQPIAGGVGPLLSQLAPDWFDTNHAQDAAAVIKQATMKEIVSLEIFTAKALLKSGTLSPDQFHELSAVMPSPTAPDTAEFRVWYSKHENSHDWQLNGSTLAGAYGNLQQHFDLWQR